MKVLRLEWLNRGFTKGTSIPLGADWVVRFLKMLIESQDFVCYCLEVVYSLQHLMNPWNLRIIKGVMSSRMVTLLIGIRLYERKVPLKWPCTPNHWLLIWLILRKEWGGCTLRSTRLHDICFAQNACVFAIKMQIPPWIKPPTLFFLEL